MKKLIILLSIILFFGCSTQKNKTLNKKFHSVVSTYNVLFNGNESIKEGEDSFLKSYKEDFWEILPVEPIEETNKIITVDGLENKSFLKAEEKAAKAIQKHSMNIYGKERNKKIDDAYLLLGKSRYYTERFIPAVDAYNYIIANYPNASLINETKIWRAKAHIRIENEELAIETLEILLRKPELPDFIREEANTTLAMAYTKMDSVHRVRKHLWEATKTSKNTIQKARNLFVLGQLYGLDGIKDTASIVFKKLINLFFSSKFLHKIFINQKV